MDAHHSSAPEQQGSGFDPAAFWEGQKHRLDQALAPLLRDAEGVVYLDYPVHSNIGDQLIYLGTEFWLKTLDIPVMGRWNLFNFGSRRLPDKAVILLHGGGNFGDLYGHQAFREKIVRRYPTHRIVFLPQTVFFEHVEPIETARQVLNRHDDLHILLRDPASLDFVSSEFSGTRSVLTPDMAVFLHPIEQTLGQLERPTGPGESLMCLLRKDRERIPYDDDTMEDCSWIGDWRNLGLARHYRMKMWNLTARLMRQDRMASGFVHDWHKTALQTAAWTAARFLAAGRIRTSRLHGHILASLLGIENELLDNSYGKNSAYFNAWHRPLEQAGLARLR